jgi:hypothetical protein
MLKSWPARPFHRAIEATASAAKMPYTAPDTLSASWGRSCQRPEKETTAAHTPRRSATQSENCPRSVIRRYAFASL